MMKKIFIVVIVLMGILIGITGCTTKSYIGKFIDYRAKGVCNCRNKPCHCNISSRHFDFVFDIHQINEQEYEIKGEIIRTMNKSDITIELGTFDFLLAQKGEIIDYISVRAPMNALKSSKPKDFNEQFQCQKGFDAVAVVYNLRGRQ